LICINVITIPLIQKFKGGIIVDCLICGKEIPKEDTSYFIQDGKGMVLDACEDCHKKAESLSGSDDLKSKDGHFTIKKAGDTYDISYS